MLFTTYTKGLKDQSITWCCTGKQSLNVLRSIQNIQIRCVRRTQNIPILNWVVQKRTNGLYKWSQPQHADSVRKTERIMTIRSASLGPTVTGRSGNRQIPLLWLQYWLDACRQPLSFTEYSCENTGNPPLSPPNVRILELTHSFSISHFCRVWTLTMFSPTSLLAVPTIILTACIGRQSQD